MPNEKQKSSLYLPALLRWLSLVEKGLIFKVSWQIESYPLRNVAAFILYRNLYKNGIFSKSTHYLLNSPTIIY